jgi:preprotein translocase subunit SecA
MRVASSGPNLLETEQAQIQDLDDGAGMAEPPRRPQAEIDLRDPSTWGKVARNASCPCGSGKKYKHCHGRV